MVFDGMLKHFLKIGARTIPTLLFILCLFLDTSVLHPTQHGPLRRAIKHRTYVPLKSGKRAFVPFQRRYTLSQLQLSGAGSVPGKNLRSYKLFLTPTVFFHHSLHESLASPIVSSGVERTARPDIPTPLRC